MENQPVNFGVAILASGGIDALQTSFSLATGQGTNLPDPAVKGPFWLTLFDYTTYRVPWLDPNREIIKVTGRTGDSITACVRGQQGTAAAAHNTVGKTYYGINAFTSFDAIEIPFIVEAVMLGSSVNEVTVNISGVNSSTKYVPSWGLNDVANPASAYSQPPGGLYVAAKGDGYVTIRANADQGGVDRRIAIHVQRVAA